MDKGLWWDAAFGSTWAVVQVTALLTQTDVTASLTWAEVQV